MPSSSPRPSTSGPSSGPSAGSIRRVLLLADLRKAEVGDILPAMERFLVEQVESVSVERDLREFSKRSRDPDEPRLDLVVVVGGDGSILSAVRAFAAHPVPILGINYGRVGFLAPVPAREWRDGLREVLEGRAVVEPRMRLVAELQRPRGKAGPPLVALNDLVVSRGAVQGLVTLSLSVGEQWVSEYRADGLIFATPSGSTAHSLAAGGPILAPSMTGIIVTPICPHALSHRPLVLHPDSAILVRVERASGLVTLAVDGHGFHPLEVGDCLSIRRHARPYPLLTRPNLDPWKRLRERLGWRGSLEPHQVLDHPPEPDGPGVGQGEVL